MERVSYAKNRGGWLPKVGQSTERLLKRKWSNRPTATVAERQRFLEPLAGTQLSEAVGTSMRDHEGDEPPGSSLQVYL